VWFHLEPEKAPVGGKNGIEECVFIAGPEDLVTVGKFG